MSSIISRYILKETIQTWLVVTLVLLLILTNVALAESLPDPLHRRGLLLLLSLQPMVLAEIMWGLVYSDGDLADKEAYLLRKICNLLRLEPGYLAEARKRAEDVDTPE